MTLAKVNKDKDAAAVAAEALEDAEEVRKAKHDSKKISDLEEMLQ